MVIDVVLSVVVPVYNTEFKYLNRMIDSFRDLNPQSKVELILVDDGSRDDVGSLLDSLINNLSIACNVIHCKNGGQNKARVIGALNARGVWIQFLDSDDFLDVHTLLGLVYQADFEQADIVMCDYFAVADSNEFVNNASQDNEPILSNTSPKQMLLKAGSVWKLLIRRSLFLHMNFSYADDLRIGEDLAMSVGLIMQSRSPMLTSAKYYYYYQNEESVSHSGNKDAAFEIEKAFDSIKAVYVDDIAFGSEIEWLAVFHVFYWNSIRLFRWGFLNRESYIQMCDWLDDRFPDWRANDYLDIIPIAQTKVFKILTSGSWMRVWLLLILDRLFCKIFRKSLL